MLFVNIIHCVNPIFTISIILSIEMCAIIITYNIFLVTCYHPMEKLYTLVDLICMSLDERN